MKHLYKDTIEIYKPSGNVNTDGTPDGTMVLYVSTKGFLDHNNGKEINKSGENVISNYTLYKDVDTTIEETFEVKNGNDRYNIVDIRNYKYHQELMLVRVR